IFELVAPAHARLALHHIDYALDLAVVMRAGLGVGVDGDGAGPQLLRAGIGIGDGGGAVHARRLRRVGVELGALHHAHAVPAPVGLVAHGILRHLLTPRAATRRARHRPSPPANARRALLPPSRRRRDA